MPTTIQGIVKKNLGRGKKHGFPTANISVPSEVDDGIYLGYAVILSDLTNVRKGEKLPALIFVGAALTFGDTERFAEAYILDFHGDLYDLPVEFHLLERLRDARKFVSAEEMIKQIKEDEKIARVYFNLP